METSNLLGIKIAAQLIIFSFVVAVLIIAKPVLIPLAWSLMIGLASMNMMEEIENRIHLPRGILILFYIVFILIIIFFLLYFFYAEINFILSDLGAINDKISTFLHDLSVGLASMGVHIPDHIDKKFISDLVHKNTSSIFSFISGLGLNLRNIILIIFYLFFILYYRDLVPMFFIKKFHNKDSIEMRHEEILKSIKVIRGYLLGMLLITLVSGIMYFIIFMVFGMPYALFFAFFLAFLNLIPFIGNPVGLIIIMIFSLITYESLLFPTLIFISLFIANFLQDNMIRPWLFGNQLKLNAFTIFVAVIFGGALWGVSGMILFIPLMGIIKIILEENEKTAPYAIFFSEISPKNIAHPPSEVDDYYLNEAETPKEKVE